MAILACGYTADVPCKLKQLHNQKQLGWHPNSPQNMVFMLHKLQIQFAGNQEPAGMPGSHSLCLC
jgi:hypothetical protein